MSKCVLTYNHLSISQTGQIFLPHTSYIILFFFFFTQCLLLCISLQIERLKNNSEV